MAPAPDQVDTTAASHHYDLMVVPGGSALPAFRATSLVARLQAVARHAADNGVTLTPLSRAQALALEPALEARAALLSPDSGIVDSHALMTALLADAEQAGALLALKSPLTAARRDGDSWVLESQGDAST